MGVKMDTQEKITKERLDKVINEPEVKISKVDDIKIPENNNIISRSDYLTKDIIVIAVAIIGICSLFVLAKPEIIITSVLSGLFGMSVPNNKNT